MQSTAAAIYARQSQDQTGTGLAVARQEAECLARASALGWPVAEVYVDNDVSATKRGVVRPAYQRLLGDLEVGRRDAVIVWDLDRLHRKPVELEQFMDLAERMKVGLATVSGDVDLATDNGRLFARIKGAVAASEGERKAARIRAKNDQAARSGTYSNYKTMAFGYRGDDLESAEAELVRRGIEAVIRGESISSVTAAFAASGVPPRNATAWTRKSVRDILARPRNAAIVVLRGQEVGPASWPAIVPVDTFRALQAVLDDPSRKYSPGNKPTLLLSGLLVCGVCGETGFRGASDARRVGGVRRLLYRCTGCFGIAVGRDLADDVVTERLCTDLSTDQAGAWTRLGDPDSIERIKAIRLRLAEIATEEEEVASSSVAMHLKLKMGEALNVERTQLQTEVARLAQQDAITSLILDLSTTPYRNVTPDDPIESGITSHWLNAQDVRARFEAMPLARRQTVLRALYQITVLPSNGRRTKDAQRERVQVVAKS